MPSQECVDRPKQFVEIKIASHKDRHVGTIAFRVVQKFLQLARRGSSLSLLSQCRLYVNTLRSGVTVSAQSPSQGYGNCSASGIKRTGYFCRNRSTANSIPKSGCRYLDRLSSILTAQLSNRASPSSSARQVLG